MRDLGNTTEELRANSPPSIYKHLMDSLGDPDAGGFGTEDFEGDFGGKCYLVESEEDIGKIETLVSLEGKDGWKNLDETAAVFDVAEWLPEGDYVVMCLITNNAGGNIYFIPKEIAMERETVLESVAMTREAEQQNAENWVCRGGDVGADN